MRGASSGAVCVLRRRRRLPRRSPERIPARLGTPPRARTSPQPSWDHMFLCNGFCCSPPPSCFLFKEFTLQLFSLAPRISQTCPVSSETIKVATITCPLNQRKLNHEIVQSGFPICQCINRLQTTSLKRSARRRAFRGVERARIMYHYSNGTIYSGIITRRDIKFVMGYFKADMSCRVYRWR